MTNSLSSSSSPPELCAAADCTDTEIAVIIDDGLRVMLCKLPDRILEIVRLEVALQIFGR